MRIKGLLFIKHLSNSQGEACTWARSGFRPTRAISSNANTYDEKPTGKLHLRGTPYATEPSMTNPLTHFDAQGQAHMVDVGSKASTHRIAIAEGFISVQPETLAIIQAGTAKKGDVLGVARLSGIMAAKKTSDLIPLCHPIGLTKVSVDLEVQPEQNAVRCEARTETVGQTGVEMEALTAVQVALLTIYDMCKAVDKAMVMGNVRLLEKHGGKSGTYVA